MERVRVISTTTIFPATYTPHSTPQTIHLTPWDLQFLLLGSIQKGILFSYSPPDLVHLLKASLSRTLDHFYPLAGRLAYTEDPAKDAKLYYIECNNRGVEFVHAAAADDAVTVADVLKPEYDFGIIHQLFSQNGLSNLECDVKPFLTVQVTELARGGCFIGCTLSHLFADGSSLWHFLNSWSEICRGSNCLSNPPVLDRRYPHQAQLWIPNRSVAVVRKPAAHHDNNPSSTFLKEKMFHFPRQKIASLKHKAVVESGNQTISSLQAVLAHIWRAVSRNGRVHGNDDVHFTLGVGDRTRTEPPLPTHYFGNALRLFKGSMKVEDIVAENGFGRAALHLNKRVASQTCSFVMDFIDSWIKDPCLLRLGTMMTVNSLLTSSSPRFDVYGNDFGWGRPVAVRSGGAHKLDGKITLFVGAEDGSMDVEVCLLTETLEALERDSEFMGAIRT
uniref:Uncharacterized protein n=1 Tax=Kalanchoe fedtschenkoi TaxID=63787 RepID=A0A7N0UB56_KALFE